MANTNIANIVELHKVEKELIDINSTRGQFPERIAFIKEKINGLSKQQEEFAERLVEIDKRQALLNGTLSDIEKKIKTLNDQIYQVKSNKEYEALLSEIDHLNNENNTHFDELGTFENEVESINNTVKENTETLESENQKLSLNEKKLNEANVLIESQEKNLEKKKQSCITLLKSDNAVIDAETYNNKKEEYSGLAFATTHRSCCENCYSSLPPQLIIDVQGQEKLVSCPSCSIFLYFEAENLDEEE